MQYGYNLAGQQTSETYPSGKVVNSAVDNYGVVQTIGDSQKTYLNGVTLSDRGLPSQIALGNGNTETFSYNDRIQLNSQSLLKGSTVLQKYDYSYGTIDFTNGNVDATKNNNQLAKIESYIGATKQWSQRFSYDELGRLSEAREYKSGDNSHLTYKQHFDFDRFGNLYRKASNNSTSGQENPLAYTAIEDTDIDKAKNQITSSTSYDEAGEVTTDSKFRSMGFAYDANGRMVKATKTSVPDAWTVYDGLGNRVATKVNDVWQYSIYDAFGKLIAEYGIASSTSSGTKYIQQDWQGSVRTFTGNTGSVVGRTDNTAFGEEIAGGVGLRSTAQGYTGTSPTRQGFGSTEKDDATGLNHAWFRKNENRGGRWTSTDLYKGSMSLVNPQSFNRYSYVQNDPINFVDPSGLTSCSFTITIVDHDTGQTQTITQLGTIDSFGNCQANVAVVVYADYWDFFPDLGGSGGNPFGAGGGGTGVQVTGGTLPPIPQPNLGKPSIPVSQRPPNIPTLNPNKPPVPVSNWDKAKLILTLVVRILGRFITNVTIPIMINPAVICEEARKDGGSIPAMCGGTLGT